MSHATQKTWRVFSSEERKIIQGIFEGKGFSNKDLFEVTYSSLSSNGTGIDSGQVPSLCYYVIG